MHDIGPLHGFFHLLEGGGGEGEPLRVNERLKDGEAELAQRVVGLGVVWPATGEDAYLMAGLAKGLHRTAGRCRQAVTRYIVVIDYKEDFHL